MNLKKGIEDIASKKQIGEKIFKDKRYRMVFMAKMSLIFNMTYAIYHGVLGIVQKSWWFSALWAYYTILCVTKFCAVLCERINESDSSIDTEYFVMKVSGVMLILLSCIFAGISYMSLKENISNKYNTIIMITIATYTFGKLVMVIMRVIKHRNNHSPLLAVIRRIGYAEVTVSILTMQRSMLVSFGETNINIAYVLNALTGVGVYMFIFLLGVKMIKESRDKNYGKIQNCEIK